MAAPAAELVLAATDRRRDTAEAVLAAHPEVAADPWVRLVLDRGWEGDPSAVGGPRGWAPVLYAAHSVFAPIGVLRALLAAGADPNASFENEYGSMSALYGAAGVVHDVAMTRALLEAGANPDDGESLYHATESPDPALVALLLEHGAHVDGSNAIAHALDDERMAHLRLLLEAGFSDDPGAVMAHAVRRGRGPEYVRLLAAHGIDVDRMGGETWRGDVPLRTPYQHAALRARDDVMAALAELGADTSVDPEDLLVAAVARGERPPRLPADLDVDRQEVLILAALRGHADLVLDLVGPDFRGVIGGSPERSLVDWLG